MGSIVDFVWGIISWAGHIAWWGFGITLWILIAGGAAMLIWALGLSAWRRIRRPRV